MSTEIEQMYESVVNDEIDGCTLTELTAEIAEKGRELDALIKTLDIDTKTLLKIDEIQVELCEEYEKRGFSVGISLGVRLGARAADLHSREVKKCENRNPCG